MTFEYDKTDHNRLADQLAARLVSETAKPDIAEPAKVEPIRRPRKPRTEASAVIAEAPVEVSADTAPIERVTLTDPIEVFDFDQNSPEWRKIRCGIPTASNFQTILTPGKTAAQQKTRRTYMLKLVGEILTGLPADMVETYDMKRGHIVEPEARDLYALETGTDPTRVGFIRRGRVGCSPDSLIGEDGGLEIKTKLPHLLIDLIDRGEFPEEHKAQVQGALWLTDREWWDLKVVAVVEIDGTPTLAPNMPSFLKRVYRDETYIANLASEVARFNTDLDAIVADMRGRIEKETISSFEFAAAAA